MTTKGKEKPGLGRFLSLIVIMGMGLFIPAGTIFWLEGWIYIGIMVLFFYINVTYLSKHDPELIKERAEVKTTERWDKIIIIIMGIVFIPWFIIPGIDAVLLKWSFMPFYVKIIGFIGIALSFALIHLVMRENSYLARTVKIQEERGHNVITTGPYKYIRHPMYLGMIFYFICHSLALGSLYSLIPGVIACVLLIIRTILEDKMLQEQLNGYKEYTNQTNYKIIPGIW